MILDHLLTLLTWISKMAQLSQELRQQMVIKVLSAHLLLVIIIRT